MMKRFSFWATLLLSVCLIACESNDEEVTVPEPEPEVPVDPQPTPPDPPQPTPDPVKPAPGTYTFVLPEGDFKPAWEAGDAISIRGRYIPDMFSISLTADQISEDGKTATVELSNIPSILAPPDWLYAAYPAGDVNIEGTIGDATTRFTGYGPRLVAYWKEGNSFEFTPGCVEVLFSVSGDFDGFAFSGASREDILVDYTTVQYSSETKGVSTKKATDGHPFIYGEIPADGLCRVYIPSRTNFTVGFNVYLKKGEEYPVYYTHAQSGTLKAGQIIDLGDITGKLVPYEGAAPVEMVMPEIVSKKEYKVNVEELSGIILTEDGESLWGVGDQGQLAIITITEEGKVEIQNIKNFGNDLEAITRDPETNTLYIGTEPNSVYRCESPFTSYTRIFKVADASGYGNSGIEGIAWYKDNTLYVGTQVGANLWRYDLDGNILDFISLKTVRSNIAEIGGLYYDPVLDWLWVTDSETHSLFVFSGDARTYYGRYKLSSSYNNESVCVDHKHNCVWVGDDSDSQPLIIRLDIPGLQDVPRPE